MAENVTHKLLVAGGAVYLDDVPVTDAAGDPVDLVETERIADLAEIGTRTFVCAGEDIYWLDRRLTGDDQCAFKLELPDTPGDATAAVTTLSANEIAALTTTNRETSIDAVTNFHVVDPLTLDSNGWTGDGFGVPTPRINTNSTTVEGNGWYYQVPSGTLDWSQITTIYFDVVADYVGAKIAFCYGEDAIDTSKVAWGGVSIPYVVTKTDQPETIRVSLAGQLPTARDAVKWWGFIVIDSSGDQFVSNWKSLRSQSGTTGKRDYALTLRRIDTIGTVTEDFRSLENTNLKAIDAGSTGATITITFDEAVPAGHVLEVWRKDEDIASQYHLVGTAAPAAWTYVDSSDDVSGGLTLQEGRAPIPADRLLMFAHAGRLALYDGMHLWLSAVGDPTTWRDLTPEQYIDLAAAGTTIGPMDGCKFLVPGGDLGAAAALGVTTADQYTTETLLMSRDGWDVLLTGTSLLEISVSRRQPGGCQARQGWTRLPDGRIAKVEPGGAFAAVGENLTREDLSTRRLRPLVDENTGLGVFAAWDHRTRRAVLLTKAARANEGYVLAAPSGKWTEYVPAMDEDDLVTAIGGYWTDGVWHTVIGTAGGHLYDVFNGDTPEAFDWTSPDFNNGVDVWRATRLRTYGTGAASVGVMGAAVAGSCTVGGSTRLRNEASARLSVIIDGDTDGVVHRVEVDVTRRGR